MNCEICGRELEYHDGVFSGWVHSNNFEKNQELVKKCEEIREHKRDEVGNG